MSNAKMLGSGLESLQAYNPAIGTFWRDFITSQYNEDGELSDEQVNEEMSRHGGDDWRQRADDAIRHGTVDVDGETYVWVYWEDPWCPENAGFDAYSFFDSESELVDREPFLDLEDEIIACLPDNEASS